MLIFLLSLVLRLFENYSCFTAGPTFGAVLYDIGKKPAPFITIAATAALLLCVQLTIRFPTIADRKAATVSLNGEFLQLSVICCVVKNDY